MKKGACALAALLLVILPSALAFGQQLVLDDSLRGSTTGTQSGGSFGPDGWKVGGKNDFILWHIPTIPRGAVEWSVKGLLPNDSRPEGADKNEIFHMYDWTYNNADVNYDGYRNGPYKHFVRKTNVLTPGKVDSMELVWRINLDTIEPDTQVLSWDPAITYRFREEWGPDGAGNCVIRTWRDGILIMTMSVVGDWNPAGHAVRIAASPRAPLYPDFGAPVDAVFSDLKVWSLSGNVAPPPPGGGGPPIFDIAADKFTLNGTRTFLLGVSYFDARGWRVSDLDQLAARRFNLIRVWCDWGRRDLGRSLFDAGGNLVGRDILLGLVRAAYQRGIAVDVVICAPEGIVADPTSRDRAVRNVVGALAAEPNVFFDVCNEHTHAAIQMTHAEVASLVSSARSVNRNAIMFVSCEGGHIQSDATPIPQNINEELDAGCALLAPHTERTSDWYLRTGARVTGIKNYLVSVGRNVPVFLDEEARRGHSGLWPTRDQFWQAAKSARDAGAAGWIFHTAAGFELRTTAFFDALDAEERATVDGLADQVFGPGGGGGGGGSSTSLASGWEDGEPLGNMDLVLYSKDVAGFFNSMTPPPECSRRSGETWRTGTYALMLAGYSNASYAYCYYKVFDDNILIQPGTKIRYWIHPLNTSKIAVDGHFTDGTTIRDGGFVDQNGVNIHPAARQDTLDAWTYVEVDLSAAAGKTLDFILVGFDNGNNGFLGPYRAYIDDFSIGVTPPAPAGSGTGLVGEYFDNVDFTGLAMARTDATVNFDWGTGSPDAAIGPDTFSVRWTGQVEPRFSETYAFYTQSDDGVRLWVNGQLLIDNWWDHGIEENSGTIALVAGQRYDLKLEYYENLGFAAAKLLWSSPSQAKEIIPQTQLYAPPTSSISAAVAGGGGSGGGGGGGCGATGAEALGVLLLMGRRRRNGGARPSGSPR